MTRRSNPAREESGASMPGAPGYHGSAPGEAVPAMGGEETTGATCRECFLSPADESGFCSDGCEKAYDTALAANGLALAAPVALPALVPPDPAALTEAVVSAMATVEIAYRAQLDAEQVVRDAESIHDLELTSLARACDAKARAIGRGNFCTIGGIVYRSAPPRKARGKPEDPGALWRLERVEVKG